MWKEINFAVPILRTACKRTFQGKRLKICDGFSFFVIHFPPTSFSAVLRAKDMRITSLLEGAPNLNIRCLVAPQITFPNRFLKYFVVRNQLHFNKINCISISFECMVRKIMQYYSVTGDAFFFNNIVLQVFDDIACWILSFNGVKGGQVWAGNVRFSYP